MKKMSTSTVKAFLKENSGDKVVSVTLPVGNDEFTVVFDFDLTIAEKSAFVRRVMSGCYDSEGNYRPEYFEPMFNATVLQMCSNAPVLTVKGDKMEDNTPVMDIDAMHSFFVCILDAMSATHNEDVEPTLCQPQGQSFWDYYWKLHHLCDELRHWNNLEPAREFGRMSRSISSLIESLRMVVYKISDMVDDADMASLVDGVRTLSSVAESMDEDNMAEALLKVYDGGKSQDVIE